MHRKVRMVYRGPQCSTCSRRDLGNRTPYRSRTAHQPAPRATRDGTRFILHNVKFDTTSEVGCSHKLSLYWHCTIADPMVTHKPDLKPVTGRIKLLDHTANYSLETGL
jgi:hypothetical protein